MTEELRSTLSCLLGACSTGRVLYQRPPRLSQKGKCAGRSTSQRRPAWTNPGERCRRPHAVLDPLRHARRAREAHAGQSHGPEPGRVVDGERRPEDLRVQAARGAQVPQRRSLHRRGREVQLPARQGLGKVLHDKVKRGRDRRARRACAFILHEPWPDFMAFYGTWPPARAGSCPRSTSSRSATTASRSTRSGWGPTSSSATRRASSW